MTGASAPPATSPQRNNGSSRRSITCKAGNLLPSRSSVQPLVGPAAATAAAESVVVAPLSEPGARGSGARSKETLEQKWAAWQQENRGPAPLLGKPAPAPTTANTAPFASVGGGGSKKGWGRVGDFHEKVAFLGDYVASIFGKKKKAVSVPQRCDDSGSTGSSSNSSSSSSSSRAHGVPYGVE